MRTDFRKLCSADDTPYLLQVNRYFNHYVNTNFRRTISQQVKEFLVRSFYITMDLNLEKSNLCEIKDDDTMFTQVSYFQKNYVDNPVDVWTQLKDLFTKNEGLIYYYDYDQLD